MARVGTSRHGSMKQRPGSGKRSMSLSNIFWNPRIEEPSKPMPFSNRSSVSSLTGMLKCCHVPGRSVKRKSTNLTPASLARLITSFGVAPGACLVSSAIHFPLQLLAAGTAPRAEPLLSQLSQPSELQGGSAMDSEDERPGGGLVLGAQTDGRRFAMDAQTPGEPGPPR